MRSMIAQLLTELMVRDMQGDTNILFNPDPSLMVSLSPPGHGFNAVNAFVLWDPKEKKFLTSVGFGSERGGVYSPDSLLPSVISHDVRTQSVAETADYLLLVLDQAMSTSLWQRVRQCVHEVDLESFCVTCAEHQGCVLEWNSGIHRTCNHEDGQSLDICPGRCCVSACDPYSQFMSLMDGLYVSGIRPYTEVDEHDLPRIVINRGNL